MNPRVGCSCHSCEYDLLYGTYMHQSMLMGRGKQLIIFLYASEYTINKT